MKEKVDVRGHQASIFRLAAFDAEGLLHALTFRILVFVALVAAAVLLYNLLTGALVLEARVLVVAVWVLITPQMFELVKGLCMMSTRGMAFGHLDPLWVASRKEHGVNPVFIAAPYAALAVWVILLAALLLTWF